MPNEQPSGPADDVVDTHPVRVKIYARNGGVINGLAHIKPGARQRRVSDVLNLGQTKYIAVTEAHYGLPGVDQHETECILVNVEDIVMVDVSPPEPGDEAKGEPPLLSGSST